MIVRPHLLIIWIALIVCCVSFLPLLVHAVSYLRDRETAAATITDAPTAERFTTLPDSTFSYHSPDLFDGDIVMSKAQATAFYGADAASRIIAAGLLDRSEEIVKNLTSTSSPTTSPVTAPTTATAAEGTDAPTGNERSLGIMTTYNLLWKTRDANKKIIFPYEIQSTIPSADQQVILNAMNHIATQTGVVTFKARTTETDYVYYQNLENACWSFVGRQGGKQLINLSSNCGFGAAVHETYHALGFNHEQSRSDRDNYVTINTDNVIAQYINNFEKEVTDSLGSPYDYGSIMHYGSTAFGKASWACTATEVKSNTVAYITFQKSTVDSNTAYCYNVNNGDTNLFEGQIVNVRPCAENSYKNQYWIIEAFGTGYNVLRFALDPTYCLTVNYVNSVKASAPLIVKKCVENTFTYQLFVFDQYSWTDIALRWEFDSNYVITRSTSASSSQTYPLQLQSGGFNNWADQIYAITFVPKTTGRSAAVNSYCQYKTLTTIDAKGNSIGQRSGLSKEDITQLQLLYQCSSGPKNINSFCSTDCKCKLNQGKCTTNDQCETGLACTYDGVSMNRCLTATPSTTPTAPPVATPTQPPANPTKSPTLANNGAPTAKPTTAGTVSLGTTPSSSPTAAAGFAQDTTTYIALGVGVPLFAAAIAGGLLVFSRRSRRRPQTPATSNARPVPGAATNRNITNPMSGKPPSPPPKPATMAVKQPMATANPNQVPPPPPKKPVMMIAPPKTNTPGVARQQGPPPPPPPQSKKPSPQIKI